MIKKLMIILCICSFSMTVYADTAANLHDVEAQFSTDGMGVEINGFASGMSDKELMIKITNDGYSDSDVSTANKDALLMMDDYTIKSDGKFNIKFNFYTQINDGKYTLYISGDGFEETEIDNLWYMSPSSSETLVQAIMQSETVRQLEKVLFDDTIQYSDGNLYNAAQRLSLVGSAYAERYNSFIADVIFNDKPQNYDGFRYCFKKATAMAAVYFGDYSSIIDANNNLSVDIWNESDNSYKALEFYTNTLNDKSKQLLLEELNKKQITSSKAFDNDFIRQTIYYGAYGANTKGYGHIPKMFDVLLPLTGDDFGKYSLLSEKSKSELCSDLYLSQQTDYENLRLFIYNNAKVSGGDNAGGGSSGNGRGSGSVSGGTGINDVSIEIGYNADINNVFNDLKGFEWAKDAIRVLKERGIVNGVNGKNFEPQRGITREEFVKMLVISLKLETNSDVTFDDVVTDMWYTPYIGAAVKNNLTNGMDNNMFGIGSYITRQDCAVLIYRALKEEFAVVDGTLQFDDSADISDYATRAVLCLASNGIIEGYDNRFNPNGNAARAEVCVMLNRLIERGYIK